MAASFNTALTREVTDALRGTFDDAFPTVPLRNIYIGPEFMHEREKFPMIYITFTENFLQNVGLGHLLEDDANEDEIGADQREFLQWYFQGHVTFNCLALTSQGRDELADNLLNVLAFGRKNPYYNKFHLDINDSDWILMYLMTEQITPGAPTTFPVPWNSENEQVYMRNYSVNMTGEFFSDPYTAQIIRISSIRTYPYRPDQKVPKGSQLPADIYEPWIGDLDSQGR